MESGSAFYGGRIRTQRLRRPDRSNQTPMARRSQNRRLEIVGVLSVTQQALTTESGKAAEGIGKPTIQNKVQPARIGMDFHTARLNDYRNTEYHRINTGRELTCRIFLYRQQRFRLAKIRHADL